MTDSLERNLQHRRRVLRALLWMTLIAGASFALINIKRELYLLASLELIYAAFAAFMLRFVDTTPHLKAWTLAFLVPFFCIMVIALLLPQSSFTVFAWIQSIPIISYLLLGKRGGFWMALVFISLGVLAFNVRYVTEASLVNLAVMANVGFSALAVMLFSHIYERSRDDNERRLIELAGTDSLTGLANRMRLSEAFRAMRSQADRSNTPLSLVVLDLDHFKQVNDRYGHEVGDSVLLHTAQLLKRRLRDSDLPCRLGGEEFAMLLPGATLEQAADLADAVRVLLAQSPVAVGRERLNVTFSAGVATLGEDGDSLSELLRIADRRMYEAKGGGRNQVVAAGQRYALAKPDCASDACSE